jgi:RNase P/RNase MRP subunit p30
MWTKERIAAARSDLPQIEVGLASIIESSLSEIERLNAELEEAVRLIRRYDPPTDTCPCPHCKSIRDFLSRNTEPQSKEQP